MKSKKIKYFLLTIVFITTLVMSYFVLTNQNNKINKSSEDSDTDNLKYHVKSPDLIGHSFNEGPFYIKSQEMEERSDLISFKTPIVKFMIKHNDWLNITSESAKLNAIDKILDLYTNVKANVNQEYYLETEEAQLDSQKSIISSDLKATLYDKKTRLTSDNGFKAFYNNSLANFYGKINLDIRNEDNSTTNIKSKMLNVYWDKKIADFIENVIIINEDTIVSTDKMLAYFNLKTNKLEKLELFGNVKIINPKQEATSEYGEYTVANSILTLTKNVKLLKDGNIVTGERLDYHVKNKTATMVSEVQPSNNTQKKGRSRAIIIPK